MFRKALSQKKGFTLVEVIVVAVIVAVLAAVAIPLYNSYIVSSRHRVVDHEAASLASFMSAARSINASCVNAPGAIPEATTITCKDPTPPNLETSYTLGSRLDGDVTFAGATAAAGGTVKMRHLDLTDNYEKVVPW